MSAAASRACALISGMSGCASRWKPALLISVITWTGSDTGEGSAGSRGTGRIVYEAFGRMMLAASTPPPCTSVTWLPGSAATWPTHVTPLSFGSNRSKDAVIDAPSNNSMAMSAAAAGAAPGVARLGSAPAFSDTSRARRSQGSSCATARGAAVDAARVRLVMFAGDCCATTARSAAPAARTSVATADAVRDPSRRKVMGVTDYGASVSSGKFSALTGESGSPRSSGRPWFDRRLSGHPT